MSEREPMYLIAIAGPQIKPFVLNHAKQGHTVGRGGQCDLLLPIQHAQQVSRAHAKFISDGASWRIVDLNSRWGTFVNGVRLPPNIETPVEKGDLIRVSPWTFMLSSSQQSNHALRASDDFGKTQVRTFNTEKAGPNVPEELLALLLESTSSMHAAQSEQQLIEVVIDAGLRGTGLKNAMMLRPLDGAGGFEVLAAKPIVDGHSAVPGFSRTLTNAAMLGQVAELSGAGRSDWSQSVVQMGIVQALCVPLMLNGSPAALLYMDRREEKGVGLGPQVIAFSAALGRMASMALSNLKRVEIERRQVRIEAELRAAAVAQKWILPTRRREIDAITIIGESRPGQFVGGDFFDVVELGEGKVAVALGDVSGHGVAASVLMASTQGFLHATLLRDSDAARAASAVNRFVCPRREGSTFVTLWLGVFDLKRKQLSYVDAGHGYALLQGKNGEFSDLNKGDNVPIGAADDITFAAETIGLDDASIVLVMGDGIIEQRSSAEEASSGAMEFFGLARVKNALRASQQQDAVCVIFDWLGRFAQSDRLSDDATAVAVKWST